MHKVHRVLYAMNLTHGCKAILDVLDFRLVDQGLGIASNRRRTSAGVTFHGNSDSIASTVVAFSNSASTTVR